MSDTSAVPAREKSNRPRIAIAGAGIGGMALAIALKRRGFDPLVIEKRNAEQIRGDGLFLTLAPNGINALRGLGLADEVIAGGLATAGIAIFNERGKKLGLIDYGAHQEEFGAPSATVKRGVLGAALLDAAVAEGVGLRLETDVTGVIETGPDVVLAFGAERQRFDAVIACDGLRSTIRRLAFPELPQPAYSGLIGNGGMVDLPEVAETGGIMNMTFGTRAFFGYMKQGDGPVLWFNTYPAPESEVGPVRDPAGYARFVAELHRDDPLDNYRIVSAVETIERTYPVYDMPRLTRWRTARVLLMGDAAHAVAPHSGQGASMALEDALVLAACLDETAVPETAFQRFEQLRRKRVETAIAIGRQSGSQKHAQSWWELKLRDLILPIVIPLGRKTQERMFGFRSDRTPLAMPVQ
jgi:2-polyprenyl-6-methoxyphenol hydroxylase-like FAD-dependent oxidoreductase